MTHNDNPFEVNEVVAVVRARHGWYDGAINAKIISRSQNAQGTWSYLAKIVKTDDTFKFLLNTTIEIERTKDAYRVSG